MDIQLPVTVPMENLHLDFEKPSYVLRTSGSSLDLERISNTIRCFSHSYQHG